MLVDFEETHHMKGVKSKQQHGNMVSTNAFYWQCHGLLYVFWTMNSNQIIV